MTEILNTLKDMIANDPIALLPLTFGGCIVVGFLAGTLFLVSLIFRDIVRMWYN